MVLTKYFLLFWLSISRLKIIFLFSQCGFLSGSNYLNLQWKLHFSKNLQGAKFRNIPSLRSNHCGPSLDSKTCKFFSNSFSQCSYEKLIRTLSLFCMSKREHKWNKEKCFLFHFESSFHSGDNQILNFQIFKCHDIKCPSTKQKNTFYRITWEVNTVL